MSTQVRTQLRDIMLLAWSFVKRNGFSMADAMKCAWCNFKVRQAMVKRIVKFYFTKVDGTTREAYGTLKSDIVPATGDNNRKKNDTLQVYYDTEKQGWRCFKRANLLRMA